MYTNKKNIFDKDASKVQNSSAGIITPEDLFHKHPLSSHPSPLLDSHIAWKINRLEPVREIRKTFGIPTQVPSYVSGATIEKWLLIDEPNSFSYELPWTEGTTIFVVQGSGSRLISLEPSAECAATCHRVSILLRPNHILWYNWWYWRGKSLPVDKSDNLSITYVGSFY